MNIFKLDENPIIAAQLACDKHVIKMIKYITHVWSSISEVCDM